MTAFQILRKWLAKRGTSELDATMAELRVVVGDRNASEFIEPDGSRFDHLEIPAYFLAEWIAENWWPLLWEPRKSEDGTDDPEFLSRHSLLAAQHGFALPQITIVPTGRGIQVTATARESNFVDVRFRTSSQATATREEIETELRKFVQAVCSRLTDCHVHATGLQDAWQGVLDIAPDEEQFCRFAGALGLDPDEVSDATAALLERLLESLGERLLMDLCLVAPASNFNAMADAAEAAFVGLDNVAAADIQPLLALSIPSDNFAVPAWRRGVQAAKTLRRKLGIADADPTGANRVFDALGLRTDRYGNQATNEANLTGAVARNEGEARVALLQPDARQRRFAAARAVFAAWTSEPIETRFLTSAVTRDQQANRAFAAELTAPLSFLRSRSQGSMLTREQVFDLAAELQIGADVVSKQADNNGLLVTTY